MFGGTRRRRQLVGHSAEVGLQVIDLSQQLFFPTVAGEVPTPIVSQLRTAGHGADAAPASFVQYQRIDFADPPGPVRSGSD